MAVLRRMLRTICKSTAPRAKHVVTRFVVVCKLHRRESPSRAANPLSDSDGCLNAPMGHSSTDCRSAWCGEARIKSAEQCGPSRRDGWERRRPAARRRSRRCDEQRLRAPGRRCGPTLQIWTPRKLRHVCCDTGDAEGRATSEVGLPRMPLARRSRPRMILPQVMPVAGIYELDVAGGLRASQTNQGFERQVSTETSMTRIDERLQTRRIDYTMIALIFSPKCVRKPEVASRCIFRGTSEPIVCCPRFTCAVRSPLSLFDVPKASVLIG